MLATLDSASVNRNWKVSGDTLVDAGAPPSDRSLTTIGVFDGGGPLPPPPPPVPTTRAAAPLPHERWSEISSPSTIEWSVHRTLVRAVDPVENPWDWRGCQGFISRGTPGPWSLSCENFEILDGQYCPCDSLTRKRGLERSVCSISSPGHPSGNRAQVRTETRSIEQACRKTAGLRGIRDREVGPP